MSKLLKILAVVAGIMIVIGTIMCTAAVGLGVRNVTTSLNFDFTGGNILSGSDHLDNVVISEDLSRADISISAGKVNIKTGDDFSISANGIVSSQLDYSCSNSNGIISYGGYAGHEGFSLDKLSELFCSSDSHQVPTIDITVPSDRLDSFTLKVGAGQLDLSGISADDISIDVGAGESNISELTADNITIRTGIGEADCERITAGKALIECGVGDSHFDDTNLSDATIHCGVGDLSYEGNLFGTSVVDIGLGDTDFTLEGNPDDYSIKVNPGVGSCYVESSGINSSASNDIVINGGMGSIRLDFDD